MRDFNSEKEIIEAFKNITIWKNGDKRAPHKPLLILLSLAGVQRKEQRLVSFEEIEPRLKRLLSRFDRKGNGVHPEYPFFHLQSDDFWEIAGSGPIEDILKSGSKKRSPSAKTLREGHTMGGFSEQLYMKLRDNPELVNQLAHRILDGHFPTSLHEDILDEVGMPWVVTLKKKRDPEFRSMIMRIYDRRCAICGYDGRLGDINLCLEAAHVKWHAAGGPDEMDNGLALCSLHHKALDSGAIGIDDDDRIIVSQEINGSHGISDWFLSYLGKQIRKPQDGQPGVLKEYKEWHRTQVFRGPGRHFE